MIIVIFTICLKMCRSLQIKQEIPMKYTHLVKLHFNLTAKEKLELHFEVESAYFMFTFTSSGHSKNNHTTFLESVATSSQEVEMLSIGK